jgi:hypothetical protein
LNRQDAKNAKKKKTLFWGGFSLYNSLDHGWGVEDKIDRIDRIDTGQPDQRCQ